MFPKYALFPIVCPFMNWCLQTHLPKFVVTQSCHLVLNNSNSQFTKKASHKMQGFMYIHIYIYIYIYMCVCV